jgi:hypothetical protein
VRSIRRFTGYPESVLGRELTKRWQTAVSAAPGLSNRRIRRGALALSPHEPQPGYKTNSAMRAVIRPQQYGDVP